MHRDQHDVYSEAVTLRNLSAVYLAVGDARSAEECVRQAATILGRPVRFELSQAGAS